MAWGRAVIRAKRGRRKPQTDRQDARHILHLLLKDDFPKIWVPSWGNRDLRQLLWHRHRMVQARTRMMNPLQAVALNEGLRCKKRWWREKGRKQLEAIRLAPWASRRLEDLLQLLDELNPTIAELTQAIDQEVEKSVEAIAATSDSPCLDVTGESCLRNPLRGICTVGSVREISRWCHGGPKRARSWKRGIQPRKTYSLSGLLYSERGDLSTVGTSEISGGHKP